MVVLYLAQPSHHQSTPPATYDVCRSGVPKLLYDTVHNMHDDRLMILHHRHPKKEDEQWTRCPRTALRQKGSDL
jgi:hypothetical protein